MHTSSSTTSETLLIKVWWLSATHDMCFQTVGSISHLLWRRHVWHHYNSSAYRALISKQPSGGKTCWCNQKEIYYPCVSHRVLEWFEDRPPVHNEWKYHVWDKNVELIFCPIFKTHLAQYNGASFLNDLTLQMTAECCWLTGLAYLWKSEDEWRENKFTSIARGVLTFIYLF